MRTNLKAALWIVCAIVLIGVVPALKSLQGYIYTDRQEYRVGEDIVISLNDTLVDKTLRIITRDKIFHYSNPPGKVFFVARSQGAHQVQLYSNQVQIDELAFQVNGGDNTNVTSTKYIYLSKNDFILGEEVQIYLDFVLEGDNYSLLIEEPSHKYRYMGIYKSPIVFVPSTENEYKIVLSDYKDHVLDIVYFTVNAKIAALSQSLAQYVSTPHIKPITLQVKNSINQVLDVEINYLNKSSQAGKYDVEIKPKNNLFSSITIKNMSTASGDILNLEDIDPAKFGKPGSVKAYAIDPSGLEFDQIIIKTVAKGDLLYKCSDYNFSTQTCFGTWNKVMQLIPGREYDLIIDQADPAFIEVGLASVNTKKSLYHPGETAEIFIVVLDKYGYLVETADVFLNITDPQNYTYKFSSLALDIVPIDKGIYQINFSETAFVGNYSMSIHALGSNLNQTMESYFTVEEFYEFDILRNTPITIDPWNGPFESEIKLNSYTYQGTFSFTEVLPIEFVVHNLSHASIIQDNTSYYLTWNNLSNNSVVTYQASAPLKTPELYQLGPSFIYYGELFYEARPWFLAIDPVAEPSGEVELRAQSCSEQNTQQSQNSFPDSCDGTYPGSCPSDRLSCDDGTSESANSDRTIGQGGYSGYGGVKIISYNSEVTDCVNITSVYLCYEFWGEANQHSCYVGVDNDGDDTFVDSTVTCSATAPGITCLDVTTAEAWVCSNFFGSSGTRASAKAQAQKIAGTGTQEWTFDVLFFNVTYTETPDDPPITTLINPEPNYVYDSSPSTLVAFNCSASDDNTVQNISLYITDSNNQSFSYNDSCTVGTASGYCTWDKTLSTGNYTWNCLSFDNAGQSSWGSMNRSIQLNYSVTPGVDNNPTVSLISPLDYFNSTKTSVDVSCQVADDWDIVNVSLYTNISGVWEMNQSIDIMGTSNTSYVAAFTINNIGNNTGFVWNCIAYDNSSTGQYAWSGSNRTVTIQERSEPYVVLHSPENSSTQTSSMINFNCSAEDDYDITSLAIYTNRTGIFAFEDVQIFSGAGDTYVNHVFSVDGFADEIGYVWNCKAIDNQSVERFASSNFSFDVELSEPNVTLLSPSDNFVSPDQNISLVCNVVDNSDIVNVSLYTNLNGIWQLYQTVTFDGESDTDVTATFNLTLPYGTRFKWNCLAYDEDSNGESAQANWSVIIGNLEHYYGYFGQGDWPNPSNAESWPDEVTANHILQNTEEYILSMDNISGVPDQGTLLKTYLTLAWYITGTRSNDQLDLGYSLSDYDSTNFNLDGSVYDGSTPATSYPTSLVNQSYEITGTLSTSDLDDIRLRVQADQVQNPDNIIIYIDSLYLSILFDYYPLPYWVSKDPNVVYPNSSVTFYTNWTDDYFLGCYIFSINQTGVWENSSCIDFGSGVWDGQANHTWYITADPGTNVQWRFYANDSRGQMNQTAIQSFIVADPDDDQAPNISGEMVQPIVDISGAIFNISAYISDNNIVDRAYVELSRPDGQILNYTMSNNGDLWYYLYRGYIGGNYSFKIIAFDAINNSNISNTRPEFNVTAVISTDHLFYERGDTVLILGSGYSASGDVAVNIFRSNGTVVNGYPVNLSSNASGHVTTSWMIPASLSNQLDTYTIEGNDSFRPDLQNSTDIIVVVKSDISAKYDDVSPTGVDVTESLKYSDDATTTIVSSTTEAYIDLRFQDLILEGYSLDSLVLYVEHQDYDSNGDPIIVEFFDGATYQTATCNNLPFSSTNVFGLCNLTLDIGSLPNVNDIRLRLTDNNLGADGSDFTKIDIVYLDIEFSITNTLSVDLIVPTNVVTTLNYSDSINNDAYYGSSTTLGGNVQFTGTEASSPDYDKLKSSDNTRWQTQNTIHNDYVYQSFFLYTNIEESDILDIELTWEGYITVDGTVARDIRIFVWNYDTSTYDDLYGGVISGTTVDQTVNFNFGTVSSYVDTDGEINILVESNDRRTGGETRQDLFTDFIKLDLFSLRTISGFQDINISAVDADGVDNCTINFINSSGYVYDDIYAVQVSTFSFYNLTYTPDYADGVYNLTATCTDGTEIVQDSVMVRINNVGPNVTLVYPDEGLNFTINDITFTWNATQESGTPVCDLYIDGIVNISNINSQNGQNTSRTVNDISDGDHTWEIQCRNIAGIIGVSETRNFTIDTTAPSVNLDSPSNYSFVSSENLSFLYTPVDTSAMNCSIYIDGQYNQSNLSVQPNQQTSFDVYNLEPGTHNWTVYCTDLFGFTGQSALYYFTIDLLDPMVVLHFPTPGQVFYGGLVQLNYTAYDDYDTSLTCDITVNGITEFSAIASPNATAVTRSKEFTSGIKYWNVTCTDNSGRTNTSVTQNFTVNGNPTVNLVNPVNQSSLNQTEVVFIYFAEDTDGIENCSLYINDIYNQTNTTIYSGTNNNFTVSYMAEDYYNWSVICFDTTAQSSNSGKFKLTIDRTPPNITLHEPENYAFYETGDLTFNFTAYDNLDNSLTCYLYIDGSIRTAANSGFEAENATKQVRTELGINGGDHFWDVSCVDDSGLEYLSETRFFTIGGIPTVELLYPYNNSYSTGNVTFEYFVNDTDGISQCSLYINGQLNQSNSSVYNAQNNSFNLFDLPEQTLTWSVVCNDTLNLNGSDGEFTLTIDNTPPIINLEYPDGDSFTVPEVQFNFTINENTLPVLTCDLIVDNEVINYNFAANNGSNSITNSSFSNGIHYWNISCRDAAGLSSVSMETYNFTIIEVPDVSLLYPPNNSVDIDGNVTFEFRVNNNNIENCTLILNDMPNNTIYSSEIVPFGTSQINVTGLDAQRLNWTVQCVNTNNYASNASNGPWWLNIDFTPPWVNLNEPVNGANLSLSTVIFNFTAYDDIDDALYCNLTINGGVNVTDIVAQNGTHTLQPVYNFMPGIYNWNITCTDGGHTNTSVTYNFTISQQPKVELIAPPPGYNDLDGNLTFIYIPSTVNASGFKWCDLIIDNTLYQRNATLTADDNGIELSFTNTSISEGLHTWFINCTDFGDYIAVSEIRNFTVDLTDPELFLHYPDGHFLNSTFSFNFTATDNVAQTLTCDLNNNGTIISGLTVQNNSPYAQPISGLPDGLYFWNVTCTDTSGRQNTSQTFNYTVDEKPTVTLIAPDNTRSTDLDYTFVYIPEDNSGHLNNCSLVINEVVLLTNHTIFEGIENNFTVEGFSHGFYTWTVNCTDSSGNFNWGTPYKNFTVDLYGPNISLIFPEEGQAYNYQNINFTWLATDDFAVNLLCNLTIDDKVNVSNISTISGQLTNYTVYDLAQGNHNWSLTCWDDLNNTNGSNTVNFIVNAPDLTLNTTHIIFNNTNPDANETLTISATIHNIGGATAYNVPIEFWDGLPGIGARIDGVQVIPSIISDSSATVNVSWNISLGMHNIHVIINYTGVELNNSNNNATKNISVLYPKINSPENNTWTNNLNVELNFTISDYTSGIINYSIMVDGLSNGQTGNVTDGVPKLLNVTLSEGIHSVMVMATDYLGRVKNSSVIIIYVDTTPPSGVFETQNDWWFNTSSPEIWFNITDNLDSVLNYTLYVNGTLENSSLAVNGTTIKINLTDKTNGTYILTLDSIDQALNFNSTTIFITVDTVEPTIYLLYPSESQDFTTTTLELNFSADDNLDQSLGCNLTIDNQVVRSYINVTLNEVVNTTLYGLSEGIHYWNVTCWDGGLTTNINNINISETKSFNVYIAPLIVLFEPEHDNWTNKENVTFFYNISDDTGLQNCSLILNDQISQTNFTIMNNEINYFTVTGLEGIYNWSIECYDNTSLNMYNKSETWRFYVDLYTPQPYIETLNGTWFNTPTPLIYFNISDNLDTTLDYSFYVNDIFNTQGTAYNASSTSTNLDSLTNGTFTLYLEARDSAFNYKNSSSIIIHVDTVVPTIALYKPDTGNSTIDQNIVFNFTANDNLAPYLICNLTVDYVIRDTFYVIPGQYNSTNLSMTAGVHYWNVTCMDLAGNINTSETWNFTIPLPDLFISNSDIHFNTSMPEEGKNITINATIYNIGQTEAKDVIIQFFDGHYDNGTQINGNYSINLTAGANVTLNVSWQIPRVGMMSIYVIIDPPISTGGSVAEGNESNNYAFRTIEVGSYHIVYGNLTGLKVIQDITNRSVFEWSISEYNGSRIFAVDYDSQIEWSALQALARNVTGQYVQDDFAEIDIALQSENNTDSINDTWTYDSLPLQTMTYNVYLRDINFVPVVNSTNNSNFKTGILWDTSDGNAEYNGTQDLVFVTMVNINQTGKLGVYDFELRIPSRLKTYKGPNYATVSLYTELN